MAITPDLFGEPPPAPAPAPPPAVESSWSEMAAGYFLSLSPAAQLSYCWQRDLDAAVHAASDDEARFFLERAASYRAQMDAMRGE